MVLAHPPAATQPPTTLRRSPAPAPSALARPGEIKLERQVQLLKMVAATHTITARGRMSSREDGSERARTATWCVCTTGLPAPA